MSTASRYALLLVAQALGISLNTAKTQMQSIVSKTGTNRQVDLVKLPMSTSKL